MFPWIQHDHIEPQQYFLLSFIIAKSTSQSSTCIAIICSSEFPMSDGDSKESALLFSSGPFHSVQRNATQRDLHWLPPPTTTTRFLSSSFVLSICFVLNDFLLLLFNPPAILLIKVLACPPRELYHRTFRFHGAAKRATAKGARPSGGVGEFRVGVARPS